MSATIKNISDIDITTEYGRLLVAAISLLSTEGLVPKSYSQTIEEISELSREMYGEAKTEETDYTYSV